MLFCLSAITGHSQQPYLEIVQGHKMASKDFLLDDVGTIRWEGTEYRKDTTIVGSVSWVQDGESKWQLQRKQGQMTYTETFTGNTGWMVSHSENFQTVSNFVYERAIPFKRMGQWKSFLSHAEAYQYELECLGTKRVGPVNLIEFRLMGKQHDGCMLYLNPETLLLDHIRDQMVFQGKQQSVEIYYSDYREVEGALLPFRREIIQQGESLAIYQFDSVELNPDLPPTIWQKPADPAQIDRDPADEIRR